MRYGVTARRKRNMRRVGGIGGAAARTARGAPLAGRRDDGRAGSQGLGRAGDRGGKDFQVLWRAGDRQGFFAARDARRPGRHRRRQRRGQDDAGQSSHRGARARFGGRAPGRQCRDGEPRSAARLVAADDDAGRRADRRRQRFRRGQQRAQARHRLHEGLSVLARTGAHADRQIVGRRARAADAGAGARPALEPDGPRRADQRSRHRDAGFAAGAAGRLSRHDPARQPRPRFSRSRRHLGDRQRGRGALARIRRRLFRHGRAARLRSLGAAGARSAEAGEGGSRGKRRGRPAKRKMSFKEKHALETLPGRIEALQGEIAALERRLDDPGCTRAIPRASSARRNPTRPSAPSSRRRRTTGWRSKSCARKSGGSDRRRLTPPAPSRRCRRNRPCRRAGPRR